MKHSTTKIWILSAVVLGMIVLIIFNPISKYSQDLTLSLNNFFEMCKIGYNFSENDTVTIIRFLEYFILFRRVPSALCQIRPKRQTAAGLPTEKR